MVAYVVVRRQRKRRRGGNQRCFPAQPYPAPTNAHRHPEVVSSKSYATPPSDANWAQHPGSPISLPHRDVPHSSPPPASALELPATPVRSSSSIWQGPGKAEIPAIGTCDPTSGPDLTLASDDTIQPIRHLPPAASTHRSRSREPQFEMVTKQSMSSILGEDTSDKG